MKVIKECIEIPTGHILIINGENGPLETLSIGDYGKAKNIKASFLGFNQEVNGVPNGPIAKLSEKWVITMSTQYGCQMTCRFCDAHEVAFKGNASFQDLKKQLIEARFLHPEVMYTDRLNIHFARMGEPVHNSDNVFAFARWLADKSAFQKATNLRVETIHPVFTTMAPRSIRTHRVIEEWADIKNNLFNGQAGLQLSINSTNESQRNYMFKERQLSLNKLSEICRRLPEPLGRKYCLNFAVTDDTEINGFILGELFDPQRFMCKITPIHNNNACRANKFQTTDGYSSYAPYRKHEDALKHAGFDVLVFVPSMDEERGAVTCGNAILGGSKVTV